MPQGIKSDFMSPKSINMNFTSMRSEKLIYFRHYTKTARSAQTVTSVSDIGLVGYTTLCVFLLCSQQTRQKRSG